MVTMDDPVVIFCETVILHCYLWEISRICLYSFLNKFMVATCFYLSKNLFPSFGNGKLIIDLPMQVNNIMISLWPWPTVHINQKSVNSF